MTVRHIRKAGMLAVLFSGTFLAIHCFAIGLLQMEMHSVVYQSGQATAFLLLIVLLANRTIEVY